MEEHDVHSELDLHGNNISGKGIINLSRYLSKTINLKELCLEWNNLGNSNDAFEVFCSAIGENSSIINLDLRNNCITEAGATALAALIRSNTCLKKLDLRWNEIGTDGIRTIIPSLERNKFLTEFELSGNKISEDALNVIDQLIERNRLGVKGDNFFKMSPRKILNTPLEDQEDFLTDKEKKMLDVKMMYDERVVAHENIERRLEEAEKCLGKEREKGSQMRQELIKGIDLEKNQTEQILNDGNKLKEEYMKKEITYTKQIQEYELQVINLENEHLSMIVRVHEIYRNKMKH